MQKLKPNNMKKSILFILAALLLTSCITQKRVDKICQTCPVVEKEVVKHDTVIKTITEIINRDPLLDSLLFVSSWNPEKITDTIYIEDSHWKGLFYVSTGKLQAKINYLSDSLQMIKQTNTTSINNSEVKTVINPVLVDKPIRDKWYKFYCKFTWISIVSLLVFIAFWSIWKWQQIKLKWLSFKNRF